ncbi:MAG TPA: helix-turn-helix domain-containing protein [Solirubrobacterales bacterium]|jgi:excisionase family DNA binding protein|nr:helix-turn-helix domain-containing protein [Solirubrobacterales bacterium]
MIDPVSIPEAASGLGLSPGRVHAMVASGQLSAAKVGGRWLIERGEIERRQRQGPLNGRPFAAHNAWILLSLASGEDPKGVDSSVRSRMRRALSLEGVEKLGPRLARRGESHYYDAHRGEIAYIVQDPRFVASGISAAGAHGLDLVSGSEADGYVRAGALKEFVANHALRAATPGSNLRLRAVPDRAWPFLKGARVAPIAAVALDLAEDRDPRSAEIGATALGDLRTP